MKIRQLDGNRKRGDMKGLARQELYIFKSLTRRFMFIQTMISRFRSVLIVLGTQFSAPYAYVNIYSAIGLAQIYENQKFLSNAEALES